MAKAGKKASGKADKEAAKKARQVWSSPLQFHSFNPDVVTGRKKGQAGHQGREKGQKQVFQDG
jgi:hypothetical protein